MHTSQSVTHSLTHRGDLVGIVGAPVVDVVAEAGEEEGKYLDVREQPQVVTVLEEQVAEVSHGEGVEPVVVGRVAVPSLHH